MIIRFLIITVALHLSDAIKKATQPTVLIGTVTPDLEEATMTVTEEQGQGHAEPLKSPTTTLMNNNPLITIPEIGVVLTPTDILVSSSNNIYQSVFIKVDAFAWPPQHCNSKCIASDFTNLPCWSPTSQTVSKYYLKSPINRGECASTCASDNACKGVFFELTEKQDGTGAATKGTCRKLEEGRELLVRDHNLRGEYLTRTCMEDHLRQYKCSITGNEQSLSTILHKAASAEHEHLMDSYRHH